MSSASKQYHILFVGNLNETIADEQILKNYFLKYGQIIKCELFKKSYKRKNEDFNETNIRDYFGTYGRIIDCKIIQKRCERSCVLEFMDFDQVDCCILDVPHYLNDKELLISKYVTSDRIKQSGLFKSDHIIYETSRNGNKHHVQCSRRHLKLHIQQLYQLVSSLEISNETNLFALSFSYKDKIKRDYNELMSKTKDYIRLQRLNIDLKKDHHKLEEKNKNLRKITEKCSHERYQMIEEYEQELNKQMNMYNQLEIKLNLLHFQKQSIMKGHSSSNILSCN
ncbi:unnamed protein product [Didymodactylos carnosus]|uniref:RRM domain-containing protein n=1 Tax=Didymodactylos carnosus TaxID=1234261 RepID=A0A8S2RCP5_9BILA|nr:unnamed protein product [Didymodactylos carnosus]CAF4155438.1 unnamed protein product [Didymodactylos carnosus]